MIAQDFYVYDSDDDSGGELDFLVHYYSYGIVASTRDLAIRYGGSVTFYEAIMAMKCL